MVNKGAFARIITSRQIVVVQIITHIKDIEPFMKGCKHTINITSLSALTGI